MVLNVHRNHKDTFLIFIQNSYAAPYVPQTTTCACTVALSLSLSLSHKTTTTKHMRTRAHTHTHTQTLPSQPDVLVLILALYLHLATPWKNIFYVRLFALLFFNSMLDVNAQVYRLNTMTHSLCSDLIT